MPNWYGIAVDLGASHGRVIVGEFDGEQLRLTQLHDFSNLPIRDDGQLTWNYGLIYKEVVNSIRLALSKSLPVSSVGVDSWGVDFGLLDRNGELIENPRHYRNSYFKKALEKVSSTITAYDLYMQTGIQVAPFNTIFQLSYLQSIHPAILERARRFLMIPDLLNFHLTGNPAAECTIASTSQLMNLNALSWSAPLIEKVNLSARLLPNLVTTGGSVGTIKRNVLDTLLFRQIDVVNVGEHDTASAFASMVNHRGDTVFISSGTWSLIGVSLDNPVVTNQSHRLGFTNERSVDGRYLLLKNMTGMWILQEIQHKLQQMGDYSDITELTRLATSAAPLRSLIDPDSEDFVAPDNMVGAIQAYTAKTGQVVPGEIGALCRTVFESIVLKYRSVISDLQMMMGRHYDVIRIVGGGSLNHTVCQWIADATGKDVIAGPGEATVVGNLGIQLIAAGELVDARDIPRIVERSFELRQYHPRATTQDWNLGYGRFRELINRIEAN